VSADGRVVVAQLLRRYEKLEMDENNAHLLENASYAMQGLKLKVPDELDRLGISFSKLALREEELSSAEHGTGSAGMQLCVARPLRVLIVAATGIRRREQERSWPSAVYARRRKPGAATSPCAEPASRWPTARGNTRSSTGARTSPTAAPPQPVSSVPFLSVRPCALPLPAAGLLGHKQLTGALTCKQECLFGRAVSLLCDNNNNNKRKSTHNRCVPR
jgi:hypothetical protein